VFVETVIGDAVAALRIIAKGSSFILFVCGELILCHDASVDKMTSLQSSAKI
jgi:hypothetical protein